MLYSGVNSLADPDRNMPPTPLKILHLEDNPFDAEIVAGILTRSDLRAQLHQIRSQPEYEKALQTGRYDVVLSDYTLPGWTGMDALVIARRNQPAAPFVFVSGTIGEERAIQALQAGATDYVLKENLRRLVPAIERAVEEAQARKQRLHDHRELVQSRHFLERVTEAVPDLIYIYDVTARRITYLSGKAELILGTPAPDTVCDPLDRVHPHDRSSIEEMAESFRSSSGSEVREVEFRLRRGSGEWRWMRARNTRFLHDPDKGILQILGSVQDVTERKQISRKIQKQASLLNFAHDAILELDLEARVRFWNEGAERLYGWKADAVAGRSYFDILGATGEDPAAVVDAVRSEGAWSGELRNRSSSGGQVIIESRWSCVEEEGKPASFLVIDSDVSEKKNLELQVMRSQRLESIGTLAGGVAHDFSNILTPILMGVEILRERMPGQECQAVLDTIERTAGRGVGLIRQVLALSRAGDSPDCLVQPRKIMDEIAMIIRQTFPSSVRLEVNRPAGLWCYRGDPTQLHQVLLNLCVNARDAMPDGGLLRIDAANVDLTEKETAPYRKAKSGPYVRLAVTDQGGGIAPADLDRIFQPFFTTKEVNKGTGLGLSTVWKIAESHGGFVRVSTEAGRGSTFQFFVPAEVAKAEDPSPAEDFPTRPAGRGEGVLVIDGDKSVLEIAAEALQTYGYRASTALDGVEGTAMFAKDPDAVDLVMVNLQSRFLDGSETARVLGRIKSRLPIIAVLPAEFKEGADLSLFDWTLRKPFTAESMLNVVRQALDAATSQAG